MSHLLDVLNPAQREATTHVDGAMLVLAGAGSGKTRVLTHRIARLIELGVHPWNIFAVTFTNKAAKEMRERIRTMIGEQSDGVWLRTFHSACVRILRRDIEKMGYSNSFNIYDTDDQLRLMKSILVDKGWMPKDENGKGVSQNTIAKRYLYLIEKAKLKPRRYDEICSYMQENGDFIQNHLVEPEDVYAVYAQRLRKGNAIDFNDIINMTIHIWEDHPDVLAYWRKKFRYIMVDEYQDTNPAQYRFLQLLAGYDPSKKTSSNIMVVGDDDQSIYAFRGADIDNVHNFVRDFDAKIVRLEQNYRSHGNIIATANAVITNNPDRMEKKMWTEAPDGDLVSCIQPNRSVPFPDDKWEAKEVCKRIQKFLDQGKQLSDMAIIYRTNASAITFEKAIRTAQFNYEMIGSFKFYERQEVKDVLSYIKLLINPFDMVSFVRAITTPKRGVGDKSVEAIIHLAQEQDISYILATYNWGQQGKGKARVAAIEFAQMISDIHHFAQHASPEEIVNEILEKSGMRDVYETEKMVYQKDLLFLEQKKRPFAKADDGRSITKSDTLEALENIEFRWNNILQIRDEMQQYYKDYIHSKSSVDQSELPVFTKNNMDALEPKEMDLFTMLEELESLDKQQQAEAEIEANISLQDWLYGYLDFVALNGAADKDDGRQKDAITLLTAHLAKGLEFPIVFVTGLWEGNFPHFRSLDEVRGIEEERRLAYVAFTRAKEKLIISRPGKMLQGDGYITTEVSTFWEEIPEELFENFTHERFRRRNSADSADFAMESHRNFSIPTRNVRKNVSTQPLPQEEMDHTTRDIQSLDDLSVGVHIRHGKMGIGTIVSRNDDGIGLQLTIYFEKIKRNVIFPPQMIGQIMEIIIKQ